MFLRTQGSASTRTGEASGSSSGTASGGGAAKAGPASKSSAKKAGSGSTAASTKAASSPAKQAAIAKQQAKEKAAAKDAVADATLDLALADENGKVIANRRYRVADALGKLFEGTLDANGCASLSGLARGNAVVTFPVETIVGTEWTVLAGPAAPPVDEAVAPKWIGLVVVDDGGRPIANRPYVVVDAKGHRSEGTLDAEGRARIESLAPGDVTVTFPLAAEERSGTPWSVLSGDAPAAADADATTTAPWIEIAVADDAGHPFAQRKVVVQDAKGAKHEGVLDAKGRIRIEAVAAGDASVSFPEGAAAAQGTPWSVLAG